MDATNQVKPTISNSIATKQMMMPRLSIPASGSASRLCLGPFFFRGTSKGTAQKMCRVVDQRPSLSVAHAMIFPSSILRLI